MNSGISELSTTDRGEKAKPHRPTPPVQQNLEGVRGEHDSQNVLSGLRGELRVKFSLLGGISGRKEG